MNEKEQEVLSGHDSGEVESNSGDIYKWPRPQRCKVQQAKTPTEGREQQHNKWSLANAPRIGRKSGKPCSIEDCEKLAFAKGYCAKHYYQIKATGQPFHVAWGTGSNRVKGSCSCEDKGLCKFCQTRKRLRSSKNKSREQERQLAREYQEVGFKTARRVPASGAIAGSPGDVEVEDFLLAEAKFSGRGKLTINPAWIDKIKSQAKQAGKKYWALHAWVKQGDDNYRKVVIIDPDFFMELIRQLKAYEEAEE